MVDKKRDRWLVLEELDKERRKFGIAYVELMEERRDLVLKKYFHGGIDENEEEGLAHIRNEIDAIEAVLEEQSNERLETIVRKHESFADRVAHYLDIYEADKPVEEEEEPAETVDTSTAAVNAYDGQYVTTSKTKGTINVRVIPQKYIGGSNDTT